ncbi:hypothetical protein LINPERPRIM_LOCUS4519 [Linum perenne]
MTVFSMDSDKHFIRRNNNCTGLLVYEYYESFDSFRYSDVGLSPGTMRLLGNVSELGFNHSWSGLEVFGVTFRGESLAALVRDLTITDIDGETSYLLVNRKNLCFMEVVEDRRKSYERVYGDFSWSKYGVVNPFRDTRNGAVSVRPLAIMPASR